MAQIPSVTVSDSFSELIRDYAASKRISVGSAVRHLIEQSPELIKFAKMQGVVIDPGVREWGGRRSETDKS